MDPAHLERDELEYELNLRGIVERRGTRRNLARMIAEEMDVEARDGIGFNWSPLEVEADIDACEKAVAAMVNTVRYARPREYIARQLSSRAIHFGARVRRIDAMSHSVVRVEELKRDIRWLQAQLRVQLQEADRPSQYAQISANELSMREPRFLETRGSRAYVSTPNLARAPDDRQTRRPPVVGREPDPSYAGEAQADRWVDFTDDDRPWTHQAASSVPRSERTVASEGHRSERRVLESRPTPV